MRTETERWLRYAGEDLLTVQAMLAAARWAAASFHAQQAAEKALKGLWEQRKAAEPPKIHDLVRLAEELGLPVDWLEEVDLLSRAYLVSRYPGDSAAGGSQFGIDEEAARRYAALAEKVVEWVQQTVQTESSSD